MACTPMMAASTLVLALACLRQSSAFVAPPTATTAAREVDMHRRLLHRIDEQPSSLRLGVGRRTVQRLSMHNTAAAASRGDASSSSSSSSGGGGELGRSIDDDASSSSSGGGGASTRLEFGVGLGAAAAAVVLGGAAPRRAFAEDASTAVAGDASSAAAAVTAVATEGTAVAAQEAVPEVAATAAPAEARPLLRDLGFEVPYTGKSVPLSKFLGSRATLVVNPKIDDPESLHQMPGITKLASEYSKDGLNVLLFPTDQGTFEADEDRVVRIKYYQFYGFGQFPKAVVFDKIDIVGNTIHPFYRYLCRGLKNPNGIARITLNYEKFLLDKDGVVVRRYPRKLEAADFEADVKAVMAGDPLPAENRDYKLSWLKADQEASKSEYAFKLGLNYYNN